MLHNHIEACFPARLPLEILDVPLHDVFASTTAAFGGDILVEIRWLEDIEADADRIPFVITSVQLARWDRAPSPATHEPAHPLLAQLLREVIRRDYADRIALAIDDWRLKQAETSADRLIAAE